MKQIELILFWKQDINEHNQKIRKDKNDQFVEALAVFRSFSDEQQSCWSILTRMVLKEKNP